MGYNPERRFKLAIPTTAIEVWAYEDYILPNTHELNKERPIDDIWRKGYDMGQKPSVEHWNYLFNLTTDWLRYIAEEKIPGLDSRYFQINNNLSEVLDPAEARNNLGVYGKEESDGKYVKIIGDTMTGPLTVPRLNLLASSTDAAYITTTTPAPDVTYLDICVADNAGQPGTGMTDSIRFMFDNSTTGKLKMAEINSTDGVTGYLRVFGQFRASQVNVDGPLVWTGAGNGSSLYLTGNGNFGSLTVRGASSLQAVTATGVTVSGTVQAATVTATAGMNAPTINVTGQGNFGTLRVTNAASIGSLTVSGQITTSSLNVLNNSAVVGGRNVVRAVNGVTADGNGNLILPFEGIEDMRMGAKVDFRERGGNERMAGGVMTAWADFGSSNYHIYLRPLQFYKGGVWITVPYV